MNNLPVAQTEVSEGQGHGGRSWTTIPEFKHMK